MKGGSVQQQIPAGARHLFRQWAALPDMPLGEQAAQEKITEALGIYEGDFAAASAYLTELVGASVVTTSRNERGDILYQRAREFPALPEPQNAWPGHDGFNQALAEAAAREEERFREEDDAARKRWDTSPHNRRREVAAIAREVIGEMRDELMAEVREVVREELAKPGEDALIADMRRRRAEGKSGNGGVTTAHQQRPAA
jgi:hypothetical protein